MSQHKTEKALADKLNKLKVHLADAKKLAKNIEKYAKKHHIKFEFDYSYTDKLKDDKQEEGQKSRELYSSLGWTSSDFDC